jgi:sulfate permease, SulP family
VGVAAGETRETRRDRLRADVLAGLTVALVGLPSCLAYAMMAGLPPEYGLATAAVPGFVAALLTGSAQIVTGPTNTTGLLILAALTPMLGAHGVLAPEALPALATLTLLAGLIRVALALAGGASLMRFIPESVLVGFTAGAAILIATMQVDEALGLPAVRGAGLAAEIAGIATSVRDGRLPTVAALAVTLGVFAVVAVGRRIAPRAPVALLAVIAASLAAWLLGLDQASGLPLVNDRSPVPGGWPKGAWPSLDPQVWRGFLAPGAAITLLGTMELAVTARARGARPDMRREILAQGWANVAGAFTACFPASVSLTRSSLLPLGGARTHWAAACGAALIVPILLFAGRWVGTIPQASLAGILWFVSFRMIDLGAVRRLWRASPETRLLFAATLVSTLLLPLEWAILLGAGLGLTIHLARTSAPRIRLLRPSEGRLVPIARAEALATVVVEVSGNLYYAAVPAFVSEVERRLPASAKVVVVDLSHAHQPRYSALTALEELEAQVASRGGRLLLAGVDPEFHGLLERSGSRLPATPAAPEPGLSVRRCLDSAAALKA